MRNSELRRIPQDIWEQARDEAARLYPLPLSIRKVAAKLNISPGTVKEMLKEAGVPIRPRGAAPGSKRAFTQEFDVTGSAVVVLHIAAVMCPDSWCAQRVTVARRHLAPHLNRMGAPCPMSDAEVTLPMQQETPRTSAHTPAHPK